MGYSNILFERISGTGFAEFYQQPSRWVGGRRVFGDFRTGAKQFHQVRIRNHDYKIVLPDEEAQICVAS